MELSHVQVVAFLLVIIAIYYFQDRGLFESYIPPANGLVPRGPPPLTALGQPTVNDSQFRASRRVVAGALGDPQFSEWRGMQSSRTGAAPPNPSGSGLLNPADLIPKNTVASEFALKNPTGEVKNLLMAGDASNIGKVSSYDKRNISQDVRGDLPVPRVAGLTPFNNSTIHFDPYRRRLELSN